MTTGRFELRISCIRSSYLTHKTISPNRLGGFGVPEFFISRQKYLTYVEILNFEPSFKLHCCRAQDLLGSQIPVTTGGF